MKQTDIYGVTIDNLGYALNKAYEMDLNGVRGWHFTKGTRHVWQTQGNKWQTANLIDESYKDHQLFIDFESALNREI